MADDVFRVVADWLCQVARRLPRHIDPDLAPLFEPGPQVRAIEDFVQVVWTVLERDDGPTGVNLEVYLQGDTATVYVQPTVQGCREPEDAELVGELPLSDPKFFEKVEEILGQTVRQILADPDS